MAIVKKDKQKTLKVQKIGKEQKTNSTDD